MPGDDRDAAIGAMVAGVDQSLVVPLFFPYRTYLKSMVGRPGHLPVDDAPGMWAWPVEDDTYPMEASFASIGWQACSREGRPR